MLPLQDRRGILFVGSLRFAPNASAVEYLCTKILPRVDTSLLARHPVYIVGDGLKDAVRRLADARPHVRMVGWVPSISPYLERARVSVVPLLYGAGTKRKLLQALMCGTPAVSTSIGIEGLNLRDRRHVLVADDPVSFADAISRLLNDEQLWRLLQRAGRTYMAATHGLNSSCSSLMKVVKGVLKETNGSSISNFAESAVLVSNARQYHQLVHRIYDAVESTVPDDANVVVVSKGDDALLQLGGRQAWHFPQTDGGRYAGHHPGTSDEAITQLEWLHTRGAAYLVVPAFALWWLDHYVGFKTHLDRYYQVMLERSDTCLIYARRGHRSEGT